LTVFQLYFVILCLLQCSAAYFDHPQSMLFSESEKPSFTHIQTTRKLILLYNKRTWCRNSLFRGTSYKCEI